MSLTFIKAFIEFSAVILLTVLVFNEAKVISFEKRAAKIVRVFINACVETYKDNKRKKCVGKLVPLAVNSEAASETVSKTIMTRSASSRRAG